MFTFKCIGKEKLFSCAPFQSMVFTIYSFNSDDTSSVILSVLQQPVLKRSWKWADLMAKKTKPGISHVKMLPGFWVYKG